MEQFTIAMPEVANIQLPDPDLLQYYEDLETRTFWLASEIGMDTCNLIQLILKWNREDKDIPVEERKPIKILFFSPGGDLDVEEAIVSTIKMSKTPVYGVAVGCVASAASLIYISCHKRYALPNAYWILHKGSCNIGGTYDQVKAAMDDYEIQISKMLTFYQENTKFTDSEIKENITTDWYVHLDTALEKGVADELLTDLDILF